jgi:hypothetical protein
MGIVVSADGSSRQPAPQGTHMAYCFGIYDLGTQTGSFNGKPKISKKLWLHFELMTEKDAEGKPVVVGSFFPANLNGDNNSLRKMLEQWRGRQFTPEELKGFDLRNIVGKPCMVTIIHETKDTKTRDKLAGITQLPKGITAPTAMVHPKTILDLDAFDKTVYDSLPKFLQDFIYKSPEGLKAVVPGGQQSNGNSIDKAMTGDDANSDIPF